MKARRNSFAWTPQALAELRGWRSVGLQRAGKAEFDAIVTDTRQVARPGFLFVALKGKRYDGHRYVAEAVAKGAAGVVVDADSSLRAPAGVVTYLVRDTGDALGQLARMKRDAFRGTVAALTGSAGKSTTKTLVAALSGSGLYVNPGNFNNQIGVPLSIIAAPMTASAWLLEFGMNASGEIAALTEMVAPDVGLLLPAGTAHAGAFKSPHDIVRAKAELANTPSRPGRLLVCGEQYDRLLPSGKVVRIGGANDKYACRHVGGSFPAGEKYEISEGNWRRRIEVPLQGAHWEVALAAAWALARELGLAERRHVSRFARLPSMPGRMQLEAWKGGWRLDDSYNASPESYHAFLDYLANLDPRLKLRLVLGDMFELGKTSRAAHLAVAKRVAKLPATSVQAVGERTAAALKRAGVRFTRHDSAAEALAAATARWRPGSFLGIKGAHGTGLYDALRANGDVR